ncbi:MAG: acyltransferase family protein [Gammaproteobacteria bacterium]
MNKPRLAYIDNLKALLIIFIVLQHVANTYSGIGMWYYNEHSSLTNITFYSFFSLEALTQAYSMSLFFMIAAYFIPKSLEKKGTKKFIADRFYRLGMPIVIYIFLIHPICVKMSHPDINLGKWLIHGLLSFRFLGWTGPLWFALTLLIFTLIYLACKNWIDVLVRKYSFAITTKNVWLLILLITLSAFAIRLVFPIGSAFLGLQFCFFAAYIVMFTLGIIAYQKNLFARISYQLGIKWLIAAFAIGTPIWILVLHFAISAKNTISPSVFGGWHLLALGNAFRESFFCVAVIIALIGIFQARFNTQNTLQKFLSTNAFGVYVFHAPIVVATTLLFKNMPWPPLTKFAIVACIAVPASFCVSHIIRTVPILNKLFS